MACSLSCIAKSGRYSCVYPSVSCTCSGAFWTAASEISNEKAVYLREQSFRDLDLISRMNTCTFSLSQQLGSALLCYSCTRARVMIADTVHISCGCYLQPLFAESVRHLVRWRYMLCCFPCPGLPPSRLIDPGAGVLQTRSLSLSLVFDTFIAAGSGRHAVLSGFIGRFYFTCPVVAQADTKKTHTHTHTISHVILTHLLSLCTNQNPGSISWRVKIHFEDHQKCY